MERFVETANGLVKIASYFSKNSIIDAGQGSRYASENLKLCFKSEIS